MGCWSIARGSIPKKKKKKKRRRKSIKSGFLDNLLESIYTPGRREALCEQSVLPKHTTHWPCRSQTWNSLPRVQCTVSLLLGEPVANVGTPHQMLTCQQSVNIKINCLSNTHSRSENNGNCQEGIAPLDIFFAPASTNPNSWAWMSESVSCSSTTGLHPSPPSSKKTKKRGLRFIWIFLNKYSFVERGTLREKFLNPLTPMSDQDRISSHNINTISIRQVMRIKKM